MSYITRAILESVQETLDGWKTAEVEVPELGEGATALVRELSAAEKDRVSLKLANADGTVDVRRAEGMKAQIVAYGLIDENGKQLVPSSKDRKLLENLPAGVISRLSEAIEELSGMDGEDVHSEFTCPNCATVTDINLTQLLKDANERKEPSKN